ncbi:hypothetical protein [Streptomyces sp. NPDC097610]|uniref:hypothetical protein n=1 Tax=Streptomyces sp. NPDC097610 TaxID=3157227 RepID=UPI003329C3ED
MDYIPENWWTKLDPGMSPDHSYRTKDRYDLKSAAIHVESSFVMNEIAELCLSQRVSVAYDISVTNGPNVEPLLQQAQSQGYTVVAISVEGSKEEALNGNYENWRNGLIVSPVEVISAAYNRYDDSQSVCRGNVRVLNSNGYVDHVIDLDRRPEQVYPVNSVAPFAAVTQQDRDMRSPVSYSPPPPYPGHTPSAPSLSGTPTRSGRR